MRQLLILFISLSTSQALRAQYVQADSVYVPNHFINELILGTVVEGDSVLVALMVNNTTDFGILFRRVGYDGQVGTQFFYQMPYFAVGPILNGFCKEQGGGYYLGAYTLGGNNEYLGVLLKFSENFELEWQRNAEHFESELSASYWTVVKATADNNLLAVGQFLWKQDFIEPYFSHWGVALTKYTSDGDTLWSKVIDFGLNGYSINAMHELPNGEILLTGIQDMVTLSRSVIFRISPDGEYLGKILQGPSGLFGTTPVGFYNDGMFYAFFSAHSDEMAGIEVEMQTYMYVLNVEDMTWEDQVTLNTDVDDGISIGGGFTDIVQLSENRALLTYIKKVDTIEEQDPVYLLSIDTAGTINWIRHIPVPSVPGSFLHNLPNFLDSSSDGGYTINGYFSNTIVSQAHWYVKTDPCGQVLPYACDPNGVEELAASHDVVVYPNPASNKIFITAEEEMRGIALYNMYGQLIEQLEYHQRRLQTEFDVTDLAPGLYTIQVEVQDGTIVTHKVIVE